MDCLHFSKRATLVGLSKNEKKKPPAPIINPETGLQVKTDILISVPYVPSLTEELQRIFCQSNVR